MRCKTAKAAWVLATLGAGASALVAQRVRPSAPPPPAHGWRAVTVARELEFPWAMAWLRDGRMLVTGREGKLYLVNGGDVRRIPINGLPPLFTGGQGGLMDIALHPDYARNRYVYLTLSTGTEAANRTILVRGVFDGKQMSRIQTLFQASPNKPGGQHFGSRLLWLPDRTLLMSVGDGGNPPNMVAGILARENGQRLDRHLGKILRLTDAGKPAPGNPFLNRPNAKPEVWSYGHRNIQGLARDPATGRVWATEHGPRGGDELNLIRKGANYGWPRASYGRDYRTGEPIGQLSVPGMADPKVAWIPAHAPSGLAVYTGQRFPHWRGSVFSGGLAAEDIRRVNVDKNGNVTGQNRLEMGTRIRDVRQGPDGHLYALTDDWDGRLLRIEPAR